MSRPLFLPTPRQVVFLGAIGLAALACGFYLRYQVIEQASVGIACEAGQLSWTCSNRRTAIALFNASAFGWTALAASALNLIRPSVVLCAIALAASGFGIVLYNVALSSLAVALLILSLARPAPETE
jgi:hypothetical protein